REAALSIWSRDLGRGFGTNPATFSRADRRGFIVVIGVDSINDGGLFSYPCCPRAAWDIRCRHSTVRQVFRNSHHLVVKLAIKAGEFEGSCRKPKSSRFIIAIEEFHNI